MKNSNLDRISKFGKRTFTTERVPVSSALGRALIYGKDSKAIVAAVRAVAKNGKTSDLIKLDETTSKILKTAK